MKRKILLILSLIIMSLCCGCSKEVSNESIKLTLGTQSYTATYTGLLENRKPSGEGKITINDYDVTIDGVNIVGIYEGDSIDGYPDGNGTFKATNDDFNFSYKGEWKDGFIEGIGFIDYDKYVVHFIDVDREGHYVGDTLDGEASGYGIFTAQNDYGEKYTHDGLWEEGLPNGYGRRYFDNGEIDYSGIFKDGEFEPTLINILYSMAAFDGDLSFDLSDEEVSFIEDNSFIFPTDDLEDLAFLVDEDLNYKMIEKNESAYTDSLMVIDPAYVISIDEYDYFDDSKISCLLLDDNDGNIHCVIYPSKLEDVYSEDYIGCVGYPIGFSSYENVQGTQTKCTIILGCYITK